MRRLVITLLVTALVIAACSGDDDDTDASTSTTSTESSGGTPPSTIATREPLEVPPEVSAASDEWPLPGRDYANSRAREDSTITTDNVERLAVAWSVPLPGNAAFGNAATTPVIVDDTVYLQDLQSNVWAIAIDTGAVKWTHTYNRFQIGPNGVAVGYGKVFAVAGDKEIAALDLATGDELWSTAINNTPSEGVDIQPTVVQGLVFASTVPISIGGRYKGGDRGVLWALDAETGAKVWSFDTIESPDLWGHPEINSGGGAWYPPAVDVERGLVYWGVGNPAPFPGTPEFPNGSSRPGDNLYTDSVVALDARTGELVWYHQAIAHDLFDHDLQLTSMATVNEGDEDEHDLVVATGAYRVPSG